MQSILGLSKLVVESVHRWRHWAYFSFILLAGMPYHLHVPGKVAGEDPSDAWKSTFSLTISILLLGGGMGEHCNNTKTSK